jgi:hypothetical protein
MTLRQVFTINYWSNYPVPRNIWDFLAKSKVARLSRPKDDKLQILVTYTFGGSFLITSTTDPRSSLVLFPAAPLPNRSKRVQIILWLFCEDTFFFPIQKVPLLHIRQITNFTPLKKWLWLIQRPPFHISLADSCAELPLHSISQSSIFCRFHSRIKVLISAANFQRCWPKQCPGDRSYLIRIRARPGARAAFLDST